MRLGGQGFAGFKAGGADINPPRASINQDSFAGQVWIENPFSMPVGVTDAVAGRGAFAAKFAFISHAVFY